MARLLAEVCAEEHDHLAARVRAALPEVTTGAGPGTGAGRGGGSARTVQRLRRDLRTVSRRDYLPRGGARPRRCGGGPTATGWCAGPSRHRAWLSGGGSADEVGRSFRRPHRPRGLGLARPPFRRPRRGVEYGHQTRPDGVDCAVGTVLRRHDLLDTAPWRGRAAVVHEADLEDARYDHYRRTLILGKGTPT